MNEISNSSNQVVETVVNILNEIGHELKNKIGVIGTVLKDMKIGHPIDKESVEDSLVVYDQIINFANLISQNISLQNSKECSQNNINLEVLNYTRNIISKVVEENKININKIDTTLSVQINDNIASEKVSIPEDLIKKMGNINIFNTPGNSFQKILSLQLSLLKTIYKYDSISIKFVILADNSEITFLV